MKRRVVTLMRRLTALVVVSCVGSACGARSQGDDAGENTGDRAPTGREPATAGPGAPAGPSDEAVPAPPAEQAQPLGSAPPIPPTEPGSAAAGLEVEADWRDRIDEPCSSDPECGVGLFCRREVGDCDGDGTCQKPPAGCQETELLACGCDGRTYLNGCTAISVGISIAALEPCSQADGGAVDVAEPCAANRPCERRDLCDTRAVEEPTAFLQGMCRTADEIGCDASVMLCGEDRNWHSECDVVIDDIQVLEEEEPCIIPETCLIDGVQYAHGDRVPSEDCNICTCDDGDIRCTLTRC